MMAIIEGTLVEVDGCVGIANEFGELPVILPVGTTAEGDLIKVAGFEAPFELGDWLSGSGGTVPFSEDNHVDAPCRSDQIVVLNDGSTFG